MGFLERYAVLKSQLDDQGGKVSIKIFDDEIETNGQPIMWLDATLKYDGEVPKELYVDMVDFDDKMFFDMPQSKQDKCGVVLMKNFMKYYKTNWGKDSEYWLPVNADFVNYRLQQMLEDGVTKGTFHPDSLKNSELTTEEKWNAEPRANIDNRNIMEQFKNDPSSFFPGVTFNSNGYAENIPFSLIDQVYTDFIQNNPVFKKDYEDGATNLYGHIINNTVYTPAPYTEYNQEPGATEFRYNTTSGKLTIDEYLEDMNQSLISPDVVSAVFDNINEIKLYDVTITKEELINKLQNSTTASKMKRLIRKAINLKLFHGTTLNGLRGITSAGAIMPNEGSGGGIGGGIDSDYNSNDSEFSDAQKQKRTDYFGYTFLTNKMDIAFFYSTKSDFEQGLIVLEVDVPEESLLPDDNDCPDCKTWQESLEKVNECKVLGPVASEYIKSVGFYNAWTKNLVFEAKLDNWEEKYEENKEKFARDYDGGKQAPQFSKGWEKIYKEPENNKVVQEDGKSYADEEMEALTNSGFEIVQDGNNIFVKNAPMPQYLQIVNREENGKARGIVDNNGDIIYGVESGHPSFAGFIFEYASFSDTFELEENKFSDLKSINVPNFINNVNAVFGGTTYFIDTEDEYEFEEFVELLNQ